MHIGRHTRGDAWEAPFLVMTGPYARMRHPLYVSNGLAGIAFVLLHLGLNWKAIPILILMTFLLFCLARAEDTWLQGVYGGTWIKWAEKVPLIGWSRNVFSGEAKRGVLSAVRGDAWTWVWWFLIFATLIGVKSI